MQDLGLALTHVTSGPDFFGGDELSLAWPCDNGVQNEIRNAFDEIKLESS